MTLSVAKLSASTVGVYLSMTAGDQPIVLRRVTIQWFHSDGNMFSSHAFRPDQFIEENISILVASMPIVAGATQVKASANYEVIAGVAESSKLAL